ncbi:hypothetical protein V1519DRAFT_485133 [Lipomyces tetrasporus]
MRLSSSIIAPRAALILTVAARALAVVPVTDISISALTPEIESDSAAIYYGRNPEDSLLLGNDGSAATGGFRAWDLLSSTTALLVRRSRCPAFRRRRDGLVVSLASPDSVIRVFDVGDGLKEIYEARKKVLGDWSALCTWKSQRNPNFLSALEASSCAVSPFADVIYFAGEDNAVYAFDAAESTSAPDIKILGQAADAITGLASYVISRCSEYLLVAQTDTVAVYTPQMELLGLMQLTGAEDIEIQGLSIYQAKSRQYGRGVLAYAIESDSGASYGISSLKQPFDDLGLALNSRYSTRSIKGPSHPVPGVLQNGFSVKGQHGSRLSCFAGFAGPKCEQFTCRNDCSGNGRCVGPNECACDSSWAGPDCAFVRVEPKYETDGNGADGHDPAIWISPVSADRSRVITTTKSEEGAGLAVFDLTGKLLQHLDAGEPNNVDVIYGFKAGNRTVDLAYAACRDDDTLCLFEIDHNGLLSNIPGGSQPTQPDFTVYGSCAYRSPRTGKQYLFVNAKSAEYLQYELTATANGTLATTLVRSFTGGSGGQVEGCVVDDKNSRIFVGEEPYGLWRYDAEPEGSSEGYLVGHIGDGHLSADVEGVTLVPGKTLDTGFILVSCQGVSAYVIYRRAPPHEYVATFTIVESEDGSVDAVSNTDGLAAVGNALGDDFPHGLVVVHDDANQLPDGSTSVDASFKLVSLADILEAPGLACLGLLKDVDEAWDPRA